MKKIASGLKIDSVFEKNCLEFSNRIMKGLSAADTDSMDIKPSLAEVFSLSELAFLLSIEHEEACFVSCRLAFVNDNLNERSINQNSLMQFEKPISADLEKMRKLAMSADPGCSLILVKKNEINEFVISGIYTYPNALKTMEYFDLSIKSDNKPFFNIYIREPGKIEACIGFKPFVKWDFDRIADVRDEKLIENCNLLKKKFESEDSLNLPNNLSVNMAVIDLIVKFIDEIKHGGILLILKDGSIVNDSDANLKIKYKVGNGFSGKKLAKQLYDLLEYEKAKEIYEKSDFRNTAGLLKLIDSFCHFVAHLSCVDGAVVMTQDLTVLGFGAEIVMPKANPQEELPYFNLRTGRMGDLSEKGTRHRSAYRFCKTHSAAVAFVISQDGGVSCMTKNTEGHDNIPENTVCIYSC